MISSVLLALPLLSVVSAQTLNATYATGLLAALNSANLTGLAGIAGSLANSSTGVAFLSRLGSGQNTVLAPNNAAFAAVPQSVASNTTLLESILSYHIISGHINASSIATSPSHTVAQTFLNSSEYVNLEGHKPQAVVLTNANSTVQVLNQATTVQVVQSTTYENLIIHVIDHVLAIPPGPVEALTTYNLSSLASAVTAANLTGALGSQAGLTIFAPNDMAFMNAASTLATLAPDQVANVLKNHVILGSTGYSPLLSQGGFTSANGQPFTFTSNSSGTFVTSGPATAKVIMADVLISNGVVHVIDTILANPTSDAAAASSAIASYSAVAATASPLTAPIGMTMTASASTGTATAANSNAAGARLSLHGLEFFSMLGGALAGAILLM